MELVPVTATALSKFPAAASIVVKGNWAKTLQLRPLADENVSKAVRMVSKFFPDDTDAIEASFQTAIKPRDKWPASFRSAVNQFGYRVVRYEGRRVGITGLTEYSDEAGRTAWVDWIGIKKKMRGNGAGRELLAATIDLARRNGYEILRLYAIDPKLRGYYIPAGFTHQPTECQHAGWNVDIYNYNLKSRAPPPAYNGLEEPNCPVFCGVPKEKISVKP